MGGLKRFLGPVGLVLAIAGSALGTAEVIPRGPSAVLLIVGIVISLAALALNWRSFSSIVLGGGVRAGTGTALYASIVFGVVVLSNFLADRHHFRFDVTEDRSYSLSGVTRQIVAGLDGSVRILAFFQEGAEAAETPQRDEARNILREYDYLSNDLKVEYIDPLREPGLASRYSVRQDPSIVVVSGDRFFQVPSSDEESITSALIAASGRESKRVRFLAGHGEKLPSMEEGGFAVAAAELRRLHYEVDELLIAREGGVPDGTDVLIIAGPEGDLAEAELAAIRDYLERGGRLLTMLEPLSAVRLDSLLEPWGLRSLPAVIADPRAGLAGNFYTPVVNRYADQTIVRSFGSNQTVFPTVSAVEWFEGLDQLVFHASIVHSSPDAWAEFDLDAVRQGNRPTFDSDTDRMDQRNGLAIAAVAFRRTWADATRPRTRGESKQETRIVLFGDSEFASDAYINEQWNSNLFLNSVNWLAEEEVLIGSRRSPERETPKIPSHRDLVRLSVLLWTPPTIMVVIGLAVWWRRRNL